MDNQSSTPKNPKFDFKSADIGVKTATSQTFGTVTPDRPGFGARLKAFFSRIGAFFHKIGVKLKVYIFRPLFSGWRKFVTLGILALLITGTALGILFLSRQGSTDNPNLTTEAKITETISVIEKIYNEGKPGYKAEMLRQMNHQIEKLEKKNLHSEVIDLRYRFAIKMHDYGYGREALDLLIGFNESKANNIEKINMYRLIRSYAKDSGMTVLYDRYVEKLERTEEEFYNDEKKQK